MSFYRAIILEGAKTGDEDRSFRGGICQERKKCSSIHIEDFLQGEESEDRFKEQEFGVEVSGEKRSGLRSTSRPEDPLPSFRFLPLPERAEGVDTEDDPSLSSLTESLDVLGGNDALCSCSLSQTPLQEGICDRCA